MVLVCPRLDHAVSEPCDHCDCGARVDDGHVPDRESFWLVERINVSPPQYVSLNSAGWHDDVWQARRFKTEREAHDYWRMMGPDREQFRPVEHLFINKAAQ